MASSSRILLFEPDSEIREAAIHVLSDLDVRLTVVEDSVSAEEELEHRDFLAMICHLDPEEENGFSLLRRAGKRQRQLAVIATSPSTESRCAIEAVKSGAFDFLAKPFLPEELRRTVEDAISCARKSKEPVAIDPTSEFADTSDSLVGNSRAMLDIYKALGRLSPTPVSVLIRGETGTGKELVARALHQHGHRAHRTFVTVNCAAIPENLLESELFGHEKGSFTGAISTRIGKFEQANGATLFLDEIGDLSLPLQAKLLRVLQEKRFQRVGGSEEISVDVRVIAATHRSLEKMISDGEFREDLFYRLNVATIRLPPLRDRTGDIPLLARFFLERYAVELDVPPVSMTRNAIARLEAARLPGNVRQLQNIIRKAILRCRGYAIDREMIDELLVETEPPEDIREHGDSLDGYCRQLVAEAALGTIENVHRLAIEEAETSLLRSALDRSGGNITAAARWLGLSRLTVREKARKFGLIGNSR